MYALHIFYVAYLLLDSIFLQQIIAYGFILAHIMKAVVRVAWPKANEGRGAITQNFR